MRYRLIAFAALLPPVVTAQNVLEPLLVTASRYERPLEEEPYSISYLDAVDFSRQQRRTLPEALQYLPGVMVQKTTHGHGSPYIRGFTGRQNLLLVDGIRFNNSTLRSGPVQYWNTVDPLSLDRVELVRSQGSVLYGSDAVGGTLRAFTQSSRFANEAEGETFAGGSAAYEFRTSGRGSHIGRLEADLGVGGSYGLLLGVSVKEFGDIRGPKVGLMRNTGYPEQDFDARFDWQISPETRLTLAHYRVNQDDVWRWHSTVFNPGWRHGSAVVQPGTWQSRVLDQERTLTYAKLVHENPMLGAAVRRVSATLSYQTTADSEFQVRSASDRRQQAFEVDTLGFDLEMESRIADGVLVYGVDYYRDEVDSRGFRDRGAGLVFDPANRPLADDSTYELFGAYGQYVWSPLEDFELTAGLRYTRAEAKLGRYWDPAGGVDLRDGGSSWDDVVGSLRASYRLSPEWLVYGGISQAFRAPGLDDLSGNLTARSGLDALGSVDVDPESFITYELGTRLANETGYLGFAVFYTDVEDVIVGIPVSAGSSSTVASNGRDGYVYGLEVEGGWRISPSWTLSGFAAWQDGKNETRAYLGGPVTREPISRVMPLTGSLGLRWTHPEGKVWVEGRVLGATRADRLGAADRGDTQRIPSGGTPSYLTTSLRAGWEPREGLELTAGIENLSNEDYRIHGSGQNEPGIGGIVGVKYSW